MTADERLGPSRRIKHRQDFLRIQSRGKKLRSEHFLVSYCQREVAGFEEGDSRIGVTVTKKIDKRAARRNRLKRYIREFFRRRRAFLRNPVDVVVICLSGSVELKYRETAEELENLFRRGKLLCHGKARFKK